MRTREKKLTDFGVYPEDEERLRTYCRNLSIDEKLILIQRAISAAPGLELAIYESLTEGLGYRDLIKKGRQIPAKDTDFYAYRKKTLFYFYDWLRMTGRWK